MLMSNYLTFREVYLSVTVSALGLEKKNRVTEY